MLAALPKGTNPLDHEVNRRVLALSESSGVNLYIVGGYLRDALLGRFNSVVKPKDIDYAVADGSAFAFARRVADELNGHFVPLDESSDTARVVLTDEAVSMDFAGCVGGSIEKDVLRRDFTINALVWNSREPNTVTDLVGGIEDLKSLTIRAISEKTFVEDPLRVLRAYRFAASLGAKIEPETFGWVNKYSPGLKSVAVERINVELFTALSHPAAEIVLSMGAAGILEIIFPELIETRRVTTNSFHHLGLFEHSLETIPQLEKRLDSVPDWVVEGASKELSYGVTRLAATKVACILHDIGKPATWVINEEGRHTFYAHDVLGAEMCEKVAERMKWSRPVERFITKLVKWHLRPGALFHQGPPTEKALRRFYRSVGEDVPELMLLAFADFGATCGPGLLEENRIALEKNWIELLSNFSVYLNEDRQRVRLLDGNRVMKLLSIPAGPVIGEILSALDEAQEFKEVLNVSDAEAFVKNLYQEKYFK
ncbi:MAG: HDIG domain-containing protein [Candidatus Melainabacteria bacterium]|nr:HDIG domain-containing protein [Candidatus Melainabacteria bacterium]